MFVADESQHPIAVVTWSGVIDETDASAFGVWRTALAAAAERGPEIALVHDVSAVTAVAPEARRVFAAVAGSGERVHVWIVAPTAPANGAITAVRWSKPDARVVVSPSLAEALADARATLQLR